MEALYGINILAAFVCAALFVNDGPENPPLLNAVLAAAAALNAGIAVWGLLS